MKLRESVYWRKNGAEENTRKKTVFLPLVSRIENPQEGWLLREVFDRAKKISFFVSGFDCPPAYPRPRASADRPGKRPVPCPGRGCPESS